MTLRRIGLTAGAWALYLVGYWLTQRLWGNAWPGVVVLPVVVAGVVLGFHAGLVAAIAVIGVNTVLAAVGGQGLGESLFRLGGTPAAVLAVVAGAVLERLWTFRGRLVALASERDRALDETNALRQAARRRETRLEQAEKELAELRTANGALTSRLTEQKGVDERLSASEQRYRELFENANDIVYTHDLSGRLLSFNKAATRLIGYTPEEFPNLNISDLIAPEHLLHAREMMQRKVDDGAPTRYELDVVTRDKRRLPVEVSTRLIYDGTKPVAVQGIARDVSERRLAEQTQVANLRYLESVNRISRAIEQTADTEQMIKEVLDRVLAIFEADRAWLVYPCDPTVDRVSVPYESYNPRYPGAYVIGAEIPMTEIVRATLVAALRKDGPIAATGPWNPQELIPGVEPIPIRSTLAVALRPKQGKPWLLGLHQCSHERIWSADDQRLFRDIASRVADAITNLLLYRDLRESEKKYRSLFENSRDGIYVSSPEGKLKEVNAALTRMLGYAMKGELLGVDVARALCVNPEDWRRAVEGREHFHVFALRRRDGRELWVEGNSRAVLDDQGGIVGYEGILRDVTERRQLEAQVQHAQKLESLGVLAGGIAHDFNNLLMGILGNAGLALMEMPLDSPARDSVEKIETAALRAADLTNQMLAYSGKGKFLVQLIQLARLVEEMTHLLETVISKKTALAFVFAPDLPQVEGDATQLRQVIMNLITNASDALGEGGGTITTRLAVEHSTREYLAETYLDDDLPAGDYVALEVTDTGCGMDAETVSRIFDPFFTTKFAGRGLGLAAVLGIVRGHKGAIKVTSAPGQGSTFKVLLPAAPSPKGVVADQPLRLVDYTGAGTVLIVDDEETIRSVTAKTLERFGYKVITARDGIEAVEAFRHSATEIALVLLDMTMPQMSGDEAFRAIRAIHPGARVILSSGFTEQEATDRFRGAGLAGFIQKPYRPTDLLAKIREVLRADVDETEAHPAVATGRDDTAP